MSRHSTIDRRDFLKTAAVGAVAACSGSLSLAQDAADPYRGFRVGIQSYSLRGHKDVKDALAITKKLGLKYWESYPAHVPISSVPSVIAEQKQTLADAGVTLVAFGVVSFDGNESKAREVFEFAKAIGIQSLSADPARDEKTFALLDKLVEEYKVNIAIHNHGPKHRYNKISDVYDAIKDHHPRIGACVDTGHYLRSSESPVEAIERFKERVYGVHLKDVKDTTIFKILGEGDLDVVGCLKALKKLDYKYCLALEYEEHPQNVVPDLEICYENLRKAMTQIG